MLSSLRILIGFSLLCFSFQPLYAADSDAVRKNLLAMFDSQCAQQKQDLQQAAQRLAKLEAQSGVFVMCDCMPAQINQMSMQASAPNTDLRQHLQSQISSAVKHCVAQKLRLDMRDFCTNADNTEVLPTQKEAYCACVQDGLAKMPDEKITADSSRRSQELEAQASFRQRPVAAVTTPVFDDIFARCKQSLPASANK